MGYSTVPTSFPSTDGRAAVGPSLLLRADSRPHVGVGHLVRCWALAEEWTQAGGEASIVVDRADETLSALTPDDAGVDLLVADRPLDAGEFIDVASAIDPDWVVVDGYDFDSSFEESVRSAGFRLLVIDDFASRDHGAADLVLDQNLGPEPSAYGPVRLLHGPRFTLLRSNVRAVGGLTTAASTRPRVAVSFGASPTAAARTLLTAIIRDLDADIDVLGSGFERGHHDRVQYHGLVTDPAPLFRSAHVVVSASGSTVWELCHLGVPSVLVSVAGNQEPVGESLARAGAAIYLGPISDVDPMAMIRTLTDLLRDSDRRRQMSTTAARLVDGHGARRVVGEMLGDLIELRPARRDDAEVLFRWANEAGVRAAAFGGAQIGWDDHIIWFESRLADAASTILIAMVGELAVGQIRFDSDRAEGVTEIDVSVDAGCRGYGLGRRIIEAACSAATPGRTSTIRALVKHSNASSRDAFEHAGFSEVDRGSRDGNAYIVYERATS